MFLANKKRRRLCILARRWRLACDLRRWYAWLGSGFLVLYQEVFYVMLHSLYLLYSFCIFFCLFGGTDTGIPKYLEYVPFHNLATALLGAKKSVDETLFDVNSSHESVVLDVSLQLLLNNYIEARHNRPKSWSTIQRHVRTHQTMGENQTADTIPSAVHDER